MAEMLSIKGVSKTFLGGTVNERRALVDIDLTLAEGDFVTVIGSNGAGKSTLLGIVAGSLKPNSGTVQIDGREVTSLSDYQRAKYIGRVFQNPSLGTAPHMSIEENLSIAAERGRKRTLGLGVTRSKRKSYERELASLHQGLEGRLKDWVGLLSGGQRQSLSLLMATFTDPKILLLDEHTAALDPQRAADVTALTKQIVEGEQLTTLMVTHNMEQALALGNRLIMMHQGRIILDVRDEAKQAMTVRHLLEEFEKIKGAELSDRALLQ